VTRKSHYTEDEIALIEEARHKHGFLVVPEDPEWPIPDEPPVEGQKFWDETGIYVWRNGRYIPQIEDGPRFVVGPAPDRIEFSEDRNTGWYTAADGEIGYLIDGEPVPLETYQEYARTRPELPQPPEED
jgi:hypothetical protein